MVLTIGALIHPSGAGVKIYPMTTAPTDTALDSGVVANARLTAALAVALLVLLAAEGATIPFIGSLLGPHIFIGMLLIPPVLAKLGSTGYRFARYYSHSPAYVRRGPPHIALRALAPGIVLTTLVLFGTGVALLVQGPPSDILRFAHKLSFIVWVAFMSLHVLGHLLELPGLATADWRRGAARGSGVRGRLAVLTATLLAGAIVALLTLPLASDWLSG
jgi:hypothetical protein